MLVTEILKTKGDAVFTIAPDASLKTAAEQLTSKGVGALVVCESDRVVGVFSERDLVRAVAEGGEGALDQPVASQMTGQVVFAQPAEGVEILMSRMTEHRIRHLPVMRDGRLCGVVSIGDVVKCQIAEASQEAESLRSYIAAG
ncbi:MULTISPECIES: CBS domain-containing protein [Brevundimonas]|uniref:CBS domain-containing protein n=1 Tax=Brevundimonas TaxID=41275 RepID=UPI000F02400C|nr:CBS domain-containing protein [Brevundimonas lutea]